MSEFDEEMKKELSSSNKKKKDDENVKYVSYLSTEKYILEQIVNATHATLTTDDSETQFIVFDRSTGTISRKDEFIDKDVIFRPIMNDLITNKVILLPSDIEEYGSVNKIIKQLKSFLFEYFEVPKFFENFLPYLVMFYWVYERFPFIPYVQFLGRTGTGKTTAMEVLGSVCYKPIDASGAITVASIFRIASQWKGTLMLDEFNPGGDSYKEMLALLKSGVSNKAVLRVEGDKKKEVRAYMVKSPKLFTSEKPVNEAGFRSRIIEIMMEENKRKVPLYRQHRFLEEALHIRNKLLLWRLRNLDKIDLSSIEYGFKELKCFNGRVQQVITPVYFMADDVARKKILNFAKEQQEETLRERRESLDGRIFDYIYDAYIRKVEPTLNAIAEVINKGVKFPLSERKIGNIVRKIIGFSIKRAGHDNLSTVVLDKEEDKIKELCAYYGIKFLSVASVESVASVANEPDDEDPLEAPFWNK